VLASNIVFVGVYARVPVRVGHAKAECTNKWLSSLDGPSSATVKPMPRHSPISEKRAPGDHDQGLAMQSDRRRKPREANDKSPHNDLSTVRHPNQRLESHASNHRSQAP